MTINVCTIKQEVKKVMEDIDDTLKTDQVTEKQHEYIICQKDFFF